MTSACDIQRRLSTDAMVDDLRRLVNAESPSDEPGCLAACADVLSSIIADRLGSAPDQVDLPGSAHALSWGKPSAAVLLLAHYDTVWPRGTILRWPFEVRGARATGPGVFDMKAGIVQAIHALAALPRHRGRQVRLIVTPDEETGSQRSRDLIEEACDVDDLRACLVLEASESGALKVARKGVAEFSIAVTGRASHAGLEPERGVNATMELAYQVLAIHRLQAVEAGTTVVPTTMRSGTTTNTVPADGILHVDARAWSSSELGRVERGMRGLRPALPDARIEISGGLDRSPMSDQQSRHLVDLARSVWSALGRGDLPVRRVGGASDGNLVAAKGVPTLDGLGAVGDHAHAEGEYVEIEQLVPRSALLAGMISQLVE